MVVFPRIVAAVFVAAPVLAQGGLAAGSPDFTGHGAVAADRQAVNLTATATERHSQAVGRHASPTEMTEQYERAPICATGATWFWLKGNPDGSCPPGGVAFTATSCDGDAVLLPMWRRERATPEAEWSSWQQADPGGCGADLLPTLTAEDFRRLPIPAPVLHVQPAADWVLVNKETIVYTDPSPVTLTTDLLGYQVTVEATPTRYTYDFGDGEDLVTTDPGSPYPAFDTFHVYRSLGTRSITLTTEWSGRYQVAGSPVWRDVDGTAQTTTTSTAFDVVERTSKLVAELCTAVPTPDDCT